MLNSATSMSMWIFFEPGENVGQPRESGVHRLGDVAGAEGAERGELHERQHGELEVGEVRVAAQLCVECGGQQFADRDELQPGVGLQLGHLRHVSRHAGIVRQ